jgi:hypothetical protein
MSEDTPSPLNNVITINDEWIKTLNALLDAEADRLCNAQPRRCEAAPHRRHGVVDEEVSEIELLKDQQTRGAITARARGQAQLSQTETAKDSGHYPIVGRDLTISPYEHACASSPRNR